MSTTPTAALQALLQALSPLRVFGKPVAALDAALGRAIAAGVAALDADPEGDPPETELERSMPFLYALVAPGADANAIIAANPAAAAAAHRAIYERTPREEPYAAMMARVKAGRHVGSGGLQPPPTPEEYAKAKSLAAEGGSFHPTTGFLETVVRALRARAPAPVFSPPAERHAQEDEPRVHSSGPNSYVVADAGGWLPGVYPTEAMARAAAAAPYAALQAWWAQVVRAPEPPQRPQPDPDHMRPLGVGDYVWRADNSDPAVHRVLDVYDSGLLTLERLHDGQRQDMLSRILMRAPRQVVADELARTASRSRF